MTRFMRLGSLGMCALLLMPVVVWGQYTSEEVGFNGPPFDDWGAHEMFQIPQWSGSTVTYIVPNQSPPPPPPADPFAQNNAYRVSGLQTEGTASLDVFFYWVDPADPDAWVRLTTFNGPEHPNPSLHTAGKVRFNIINRSQLYTGLVGICLGIRETGVNVPQLADGGTSGDIEWVGVDGRYLTLIKAGPDGILQSEVDPNDLLVDVDESPDNEIWAISWGEDRVFDSTWDNLSDDEAHYGAYAAVDGTVHPIPAVTLAVDVDPVWLEWDLATGEVFDIRDPENPNDDVLLGAGIAGFTGNGVLDVVPTRGTLDHIAFTNVSTDPATKIEDFIDQMRFEAPEPDPVVPPTIVWPIINGDDQVIVTDIQTGVDLVKLYVDDDPDPVDELPATPPDDVVFTLAKPGAVTDQVYTARQCIGELCSEPSDGVTVLEFPAVLTFSLLIDEGGNGSCSPVYDWEYVAVTSAPYGTWTPRGTLLFADDAVWQTIDIPLDDDELVMNGYAGDGILGPSPTGSYTIDSAWFTFPRDGVVGPWEVLVDSMQVINEFGEPGEVLLDFEDSSSHFSWPRGQSPDTDYDISARTEVGSYDGAASHRFVWSYNGTDPESIGFLQRIGGTCGTSALIPDTASGLRFRMCVRDIPSAPDIPLPEVVGPIVGTQDTVRVLHESDAEAVHLLVNGSLRDSAYPEPGVTETDFPELDLDIGDSVSAKQLLTAGQSDAAYPRGVTDLVPPPTVASPIFPGSTTVTVKDLMTAPHAEADTVTVIVRDDLGEPVATYPATPEGASVVVEVAELQNDYQVSATQTVNDLESSESEVVIVEFVTPVIHHCPAEGDTEMRVLLVYPEAIVTATLRDTEDVVVDTFTAGPPAAGETDVTFTELSGLLTGYTVTAYQTIGEISSAESTPDTVTVNTSTMVFEDTMEGYATQDDYENEFSAPGVPILSDTGWWPSSDDPGLNLDFTKNTTVGGGKSAYCPGEASDPFTFYDGWRSNHDFSWRVTPITPVQPTDTEPVIWSFALYDTEGPGADKGNQWASLMDYSPSLEGLISVGLSGSDFTWGVEQPDNDYYAARVEFSSWGHFNLYEIEAPLRTRGWHMFTTVVKYQSIDFYVDGKLCRKNVPRSSVPEYENLYMGSGYRPTYDAYYDDFRVRTGKVIFDDMEPQAPPEPTLVSPLEEGDLIVTVEDIAVDANVVTVYDATMELELNSVDPEGQATVDVPVAALVHLHSIVATQTNDTAESDDSDPLEVGKGSGDILICIGIRETGDTGPLGSEGGDEGDIEWVGANGTSAGGAPLGVAISPTGEWQTLEFDPVAGPITEFDGDGKIKETRGVLEHLAVAVNSTSLDRSTGPYYMYVDNVINVKAGDGDSDFVITDFEGYTLDGEVLFQEPGYSGSTDQHMSYPPNFSGTTDLYGHPGQSQFLTWFWRDTTDQRWARITSSQVANVPSPIIDLTKPIRMDILLVEKPATAVCCFGYVCEDWDPNDQAGCEGNPEFGTFIADVTCADEPCNCSGTARGDSNCDTLGPNAYDIDHFIQAVGQPAQWVAEHTCDFYCANDCNCDGFVQAYDIDWFITCVSPAGCDPCP